MLSYLILENLEAWRGAWWPPEAPGQLRDPEGVAGEHKAVAETWGLLQAHGLGLRARESTQGLACPFPWSLPWPLLAPHHKRAWRRCNGIRETRRRPPNCREEAQACKRRWRTWDLISLMREYLMMGLSPLAPEGPSKVSWNEGEWDSSWVASPSSCPYLRGWEALQAWGCPANELTWQLHIYMNSYTSDSATLLDKGHSSL